MYIGGTKAYVEVSSIMRMVVSVGIVSIMECYIRATYSMCSPAVCLTWVAVCLIHMFFRQFVCKKTKTFEMMQLHE